MNWDDNGYLISKNRYSENSIIAEVFTENYGKISGIIFGGTSKKLKTIYKLVIKSMLIIILRMLVE